MQLVVFIVGLLVSSEDERIKDEILQPIADMEEDQLEMLQDFLQTCMGLLSGLKGEYEDDDSFQDASLELT